MFDRDAPVPWDKEVELFEAGPNLQLRSRFMTLRQALECFREVPADARAAYGVGIHEPYLTKMNGRPVAIGFLNASALEKLVKLLPI